MNDKNILEIEVQKEIDCSKQVALWNYWDHEHVVGTHFEHYKVVTMMMILIGNQLFLKISKKNLVPSKIRK